MIYINSVPVFIAALLSSFLGVFVYFKNRHHFLNVSLASLCFSIAIWLFSYSFVYSSVSKIRALFWARNSYLGIIFIPVTLYQLAVGILNLRRKNTLITFYLLGLIFVVLSRNSLFFSHVKKYFWGYYPIASTLYLPFLVFFFGIYTYSSILLLLALRNKTLTSQKRNQILYVFLAYLVGSCASVDYFGKFGFEVYPFGYINMVLVVFIFTYAIIRYRLLDITVAITRTGVFVSVYSLILGTPFIVAYALRPYLIAFFGDKWWLAPMGLLTVLATVGPFIFIYINKKAEDRLLQEQRRYQHTLRQASSGMIRIRELRKLLDLIVYVVTKTVKIEFSAMFLMNPGNNHYSMVAKRGALNLAADFSLDTRSPLIQELYLKKEPIVYEEIQLQSQDSPRDSKLMNLEKHLKEISASVIVPSYVGNKLLGFLVLGKKLSGKIYSQDDLNVFSVLANQAALAIENAQFYEDIKQTQQQLFQAEKMATVGTMADGLSHQINNRFQALSLIAGDSMDILKTTDVSNCSPEVKNSLNQLKYAFERIQANVMQGGEVVKGLLRYSRPGQEGFEPTDFNLVIEGALEMVQYKVRIKEMDVLKNISSDLPKVKCNLTQLQEVFFNLFDNAYDAIKERQAVLNDANFKGKIEISAAQDNSNLKIIFKDNGIGVKDKDKEHLFTPFFTTKSTNRKGTGLGLYVIQKIIGFHNGTINVSSTYNAGTKFEIVLPLSR